MRCSMTGKPISGMGDAIYDDGEWISWDYINEQLYQQDLAEEYPEADLVVANIFEELVMIARSYYEHTDRYLQIWGELGEFYGEIKYGIERHPPGTPGSDGRLGNDWVEIKTISPEKETPNVQVKRAGNFNKLLIVKIDEDFLFESKLIDRKSLEKGKGKHARTSWNENNKSV
jgi:hypothetical protein